MIPWADIEVRHLEHEQRVQRVEQTHWMQVEPPVISVDRWQWRVMNRLGGWLVEAGCRLQTHVERARQVVRVSQANYGSQFELDAAVPLKQQSNSQSRLVTEGSTTRTGRRHTTHY